jgi:hypothetical protein
LLRFKTLFVHDLFIDARTLLLCRNALVNPNLFIETMEGIHIPTFLCFLRYRCMALLLQTDTTNLHLGVSKSTHSYTHMYSPVQASPPTFQNYSQFVCLFQNAVIRLRQVSQVVVEKFLSAVMTNQVEGCQYSMLAPLQELAERAEFHDLALACKAALDAPGGKLND